MKKLFLFFAVLLLAFCFTACGDETSQAADGGQRIQPSGAVFSRSTARVRQPQIARPVFKKKVKLPPLNTQTWPQLATGQTTCYNNMNEVDCGDASAWEYGDQDGRKRYGTRSINKDALYPNEIVKDSVTKLAWTKKIKTGVSWYEAKNYCDNLKLANKSWRLPSTAELRSLINYGKTEPAVDQILYEDASGNAGSAEALEMKSNLNSWFWATKHVHFDKDNDDEGNKIFAASWAVYFKDGEVEYTSRYNSNNYSVRCVSSEF